MPSPPTPIYVCVCVCVCVCSDHDENHRHHILVGDPNMFSSTRHATDFNPYIRISKNTGRRRNMRGKSSGARSGSNLSEYHDN